MHRKHLQEIPDQSSNVTTNFTWGWDSGKTSELLSGMGVSTLEKEGADSENIPQDLLSNVNHSQSPSRKRLKSKENDKDFVIARRQKQNRENFPGVPWNTLPDELLLGIFSRLCLPELLQVSCVCKRWNRLAIDEFLWQTIDLTGKSLQPGVIKRLLSRGVIAFRCPRAFVSQEPLVEHFSVFRVQHLDLSNCIIDVPALEGILSQCLKLQNLSLEGLELSDPIVNYLGQNSNLVRLNLCGCHGFSEFALQSLLNNCFRLDELNLSWCFDFTANHLQIAVEHVTETITQLNLSGYRKNLQQSDVCTLIRRCPKLVHLDLSDSVLLKNDCMQEFHQLIYLQHLSLSRCYDIIPEALLELGEIPTLKTLQAFGIVPEGILEVLQEALPQIKINGSPFTTIARPTVCEQRSQEIWGIECRLSLHRPSCP
ncbi:PREDICTED: S-phase kinase-associated protein 2 [Chrysochloris asiatica]|uniref:S-phase kinase-associated protein 2 n=1 Tax=Chrysochloris asiatica TaxID=185453 RepID=A0A9B0X079_CHRAS|nr:PREDICTED: S-phase kinase-associated protein 2 [Chrysochloris asiatica]